MQQPTTSRKTLRLAKHNSELNRQIYVSGRIYDTIII